VRDRTDSVAESDVDAGDSQQSRATKHRRWWPLVVLAIASWGFASWLVFVWLGIRTRTRLWFVGAGVSAVSVAVGYFVAAGTGPESGPSTVAALVSVANWVGATICVLIVRRRSLRPPDPAEPVRWRTFYFAGPIDVAWERLTTSLVSIGGAVTSEDFHTLSIEQSSRLVDVEFHMTVVPGPTDATSAVEVSRRHERHSPFSGDRPWGWKGLDDLSQGMANDILELGFTRWLTLPPQDDVASVFRTVGFRLALRGYNVPQVDEFLETLAVKVDGGEEVFAEDVLSNEFRTSWKGYQKAEVDELLGVMAARVRPT